MNLETGFGVLSKKLTRTVLDWYNTVHMCNTLHAVCYTLLTSTLLTGEINQDQLDQLDVDGATLEQVDI